MHRTVHSPRCRPNDAGAQYSIECSNRGLLVHQARVPGTVYRLSGVLVLQVTQFEQQRLNLRPVREEEVEAQLAATAEADRASSSDKWLVSLQKSVILPLANFSRGAVRGLMRLLRSGRFTPDQARPGMLGQGTI